MFTASIYAYCMHACGLITYLCVLLVTLALGNVLFPYNLIEQGLNNCIARDSVQGLSFLYYAVSIMLFKLG